MLVGIESGVSSEEKAMSKHGGRVGKKDGGDDQQSRGLGLL